MALVAIVHHALRDLEQLAPPAKAIQRASFDQAFQHATVHLAQVHPFAKVVDALERLPVPALQNGLHRPLADILDGAQAKTDGRPASHARRQA